MGLNLLYAIHVFNESILADIMLHQEHANLTSFGLKTKVSTNCLLPPRLFQYVLVFSPKKLSRMRLQKSMVLNMEDYSVLERSSFRDTEKFLRKVLRLNYKHFRLNKVNSTLVTILILKISINNNHFSLFFKDTIWSDCYGRCNFYITMHTYSVIVGCLLNKYILWKKHNRDESVLIVETN